MQSFFVLVSLMAALVASKSPYYAVPTKVKLATQNCTLPVEFKVIGFQIYTDAQDGSLNQTSFTFVDSDTGINTYCQQNASSVPVGSSSDQFACTNPLVSFVYDTTDVPGLTLIETACPNTGSSDEASGLLSLDQLALNCSAQAQSKTCKAKSPLQANFTSLEPAPPTSRRVRRAKLY
ncbi:hypothetical protein GGR56DRAFT_622012 [Xylariaceae sp. FL0804]|nr:hypothetical protein GGR56DRAFT_622012 [Xylariaceae sp. FL0804]